ncbi:MAG: transcription termination/antitermination protein NusA [Oscillospiraceae bacterium]|jgi:N utilization substance protein A|nr:transcription termination/antitermination protein NusA [Oscillospiraceae bacterium]
MNNEFFEALQMLGMEKGISPEYLIEKISNAIVIAVKKDYEVNDNVSVTIDPETFKFDVAITKTVVEIVEIPELEILLDEALAYDPAAKIGLPITMHLETRQFGRIAAQTAKHVIRQGIREAERAQMLEQFKNKVYEVVTAVVQKIQPGTGNATVEIDKNEVLLFKNDQLPNDDLREGDRIKVYVVDVVNLEKRCSLKISRTHRELVKRLFEMEVPEIFEGVVEVKAISREAGSRTKIAVWSKNPDVDPIGACIGPGGSRINVIVKELKGEKVDIIPYSDDEAAFIKAALAPATVVGVTLLPGTDRACRVVVPDNQLSLAIGNKGQNAKLAARLTGYKIDIRPESNPVTPEDLERDHEREQQLLEAERLSAGEEKDASLELDGTADEETLLGADEAPAAVEAAADIEDIEEESQAEETPTEEGTEEKDGAGCSED